MSGAQKILACGDVNGEFDLLLKRVNGVLQKAGAFDLLLCVGDFFKNGDNKQWLPIKSGKTIVPLPIYILGPSKKEHQHLYSDLRGCELAENVVYLGPSGVYTCSSGLHIAYLSGSKAASAELAGYTNHKVHELEIECKQTGIIDILLTRQWPCNVTTYATKPTGLDVEKEGCGLVARLAHSLQPRYHFTAGLGIFYERLPYRNHKVLQESPRQCTRFYGLAAAGNPYKHKWLYAFTITPAQHITKEELTFQPSDVTECPYSADKLPPLQESSGINEFFYGGAEKDPRGKKREHSRQGGGKEKRPPPKPTGSCWFCLSSPEVEKHLIVSVGKYCYMALAKGGLVPHHLMLLPIHHYQTTLDLVDEAQKEMFRFKARLRQMFAVSDRAVVFVERNYRTAHMQVHAVPLSATLMASVKDSFMRQAESAGLELEEVPPRTELTAAVKPGQPYLYVEPPHGPCLLHRVRRGYNMLFDREVLASKELLNVPDRIDWKQCKSSRQEETETRDSIRKMFNPFDFTIDCDDDDSSSSSSSNEDDNTKK